MNDVRTVAGQQPPVQKKEIFGWCCFDFANSAFTTVIITVVYAPYFVSVVAEGDPRASGWWGSALSFSLVGVLLLSPLLGALADALGRKKVFLMGTGILCSVATLALYWVGRGEIWLALGLVVVANLAFSLSENLCAAFLPEISTPENVGRISGYGWSFGYFGGLLSLLLALVIIRSGEGRVPWTFAMTGVFFLLASLPTMLLLRERARPQALAPGESLLRRGWGQLVTMRRELPAHRTLLWFFIALTCYISGLMAVVAFAAIYAQRTVGMTQGEVILLFVVLQLAGVAGAFAFGLWQDRSGAKRALVASLVLWIVVCVWAGLCRTKLEFWLIGALAGVAMGSLQSAGRAVVSGLTPEGRSGEFFGYWGFFGKLAGAIGPLVFGWVATGCGDRVAVLLNAVFFLAGLGILWRLDLRPRRADRGDSA